MKNEKKRNRSKIRVHLPLIGYAALIFILSSVPSLSPPNIGLNWEDKIAHCVEYAVLGALILRSIMVMQASMSPRLFLIAWAVGAIYGVTDEIHQYFVPNRFASPWDALADAIGVALGMAGYWWIRVKRLRISVSDPVSQSEGDTQ